MFRLRISLQHLVLIVAGLATAGTAWCYDPMIEDFKLGRAHFEFHGRIPKVMLNAHVILNFEQAKDWEGLARYVLEDGYPLDVSDYYLGVAAEGMNLLLTAHIYYLRAFYKGLSPYSSCQRIGFDVCNGLHFPDDAWKAVVRVREKAAAQ